ncbi:MAG: type I-C CRISPR-associated protein Cas8c/Csd1, partial [Dehalococcoidia bacterium]|nr:type I-C CRISPR-associated protein Cas8c/Csd1 [Dehalococcoidia bacterium]
MLIPQLVALAHRDSLLEDPLFEKKRVRWQVTIGPNGEFQGLGSLDERGVELLVPKKVGGNAGGVATFGTDNARFVLGLVDKPEDSAKAERDLAAFVALIERAAEEEPESEGIAAARAFYRDAAAVAAAREVAAEQKVKEADRVALAYFDDYGQNLFESEEGKAFWRRYRAEQESAKPQVEAVGCLSCGQLR